MRLPWTLVPARFPLISTILWILQEQHTFENIGIVSLPGYAVFYYQQRSSVPDAGRYNVQIEWPKLFFFPCQAKKSLFFNRAFPIFVTKLVYNCMPKLKTLEFLPYWVTTAGFWSYRKLKKASFSIIFPAWFYIQADFTNKACASLTSCYIIKNTVNGHYMENSFAFSK